MAKGWEFFWEGRHYFVCAPDAPTARKYLRQKHLRVAQHARFPDEVTADVIEELGLQDGDVMLGTLGRPN